MGRLLLVGADVFYVTVLNGLLPDDGRKFAWKEQKFNEWWRRIAVRRWCRRTFVSIKWDEEEAKGFVANSG